MIETDEYQILLLLKKDFPDFKNIVDKIFREDDIFKEIAKEYYEIVIRSDITVSMTLEEPDIYIDTINELKEELTDYLNDHKMKYPFLE